MMHRQPALNAPTGAWIAQSWIAFALSVGAMSMAIYALPAAFWPKAFLALGLFFTVSSTISLSKTIRDKHEAEKIHSKIDEAQAEAVLREMAREDEPRLRGVS